MYVSRLLTEVKARGSSSSSGAVSMATLDVLSEAASLSDVVNTILASLDFILVDLIYKRSSFDKGIFTLSESEHENDVAFSWFVRLHLHVMSTSPFSIPFKNEFKSSLMVLFTHNIKRSKVSLTKNGDVDGMCKRPFIYSIGINVCIV